MKIYKLKNALIFPAINQAVWHESAMLGVQSQNASKDPKEFGLMCHNRYLVNYRLRDEYSRKNIPIKLSGKYLYLGQLSNHFGHFMEECLGRLWAYHSFASKVDGFIFLKYNDNVKLSPFALEVLKLFKINTDKLILISQFVEVENLIVPEIGSWLGGEKKWFKHWLQKYINIKDYKKNLPPKIIVRRSNRFLGRVAGFDYFSKILVRNGFKEIFPENYTIREQIEFVASAKVIVWEQGSACHILKILPQLNNTSLLIRRGLFALSIENLVKNKSKRFMIYRNAQSIFTHEKWYANKDRGNAIMGFFPNPEGLLNFCKKNNLIEDQAFNTNTFKKIERNDFVYFFCNYFIFYGLISPVVKYIKPILPKLIWTKLKYFKRYLAA
jgi:capsular polysaccharide biosynthesis protein